MREFPTNNRVGSGSQMLVSVVEQQKHWAQTNLMEEFVGKTNEAYTGS